MNRNCLVMRLRLRALPLCTALLAAAASFGTSSAQSLLDRPPNLDGTWAGTPGTVYFNFLHRFSVSDAPVRKVSNVPTFLLAAAAPGNTLFGFRYATSSQIVSRVPNEWEFFGRINPISQMRGSPIDASLHVGYNQAAESVDGELALARSVGRLRLMGAGRVLSNAFDQGDVRYGVAGGAVLRITPWVSIAGDVATLLDRDTDTEDVAWGAGLHLRIPYTPHTVSLHVANTNSGTLEGTSTGSGSTRFGFEFTIPITMSRYLGRPAAAAATGPAVQASGDTVRIVMQNLAYQTPRLEIAPGTTVVWENRDAVPHTSTSNQGLWDSGLIDAGQSWSYTFGQAGSFDYHCTPHPFMVGTIIVR